MRPVVTATATWTAAGRGLQPLMDLLMAGGDASSRVPPYPAAGLPSPQCATIAGLDRERPAEVLLAAVVAEALAAGAGCGPRIGLVVGTSSGNISGPWERWHREHLIGKPGDEAGCGRAGPTRAVARRLGLSPHTTVSVACASGSAALVVAAGWLADDQADAVVVAGVDALSLFVHAGFGGLGALSAGRLRPFQAERDGLVLGEGAAALLLELGSRARARGATVLAELAGAGLSADAVHMTAPDREGGGAASAMAAALDDAGLSAEAVDLVSVHGTGTVFNDAMEAQALRRVLGARPVDLFGVKQAVGHTLGAAGAVEAVVCVAAIQRGVAPPGPRNVDPTLHLPSPAGRRPQVVLSTNSAFGGANAAIVLATPGRAGRPGCPRPVRVTGTVAIELPPGISGAERWPAAPERFRRMNRYVRAGVLACRALLEREGVTPGTGVVFISESNCRASDLRYHEKLVMRGAAAAPRVDFVGTVPGTPSGEAAILWGLRGPSLVLCDDGGLAQAIDEAARLVRHGRAGRLVALWVEAPTEAGPCRAEAALVGRA